MIVAIQGGKASFHDVAAAQYFAGAASTIFCKTFREVGEKVISGEAGFGIMAIENSIAGSILGNYKLIQEYKLKIVGEIQLRIQQNLMVLPGVQWSDIRVVKSHPVALMQCEDFFLKNPSFTSEEYYDTADSAKFIRQNNLRNYGAIASKLAAEVYDLEIPVGGAGIETEKKNFTRFFILTSNSKSKVSESEKATLSFQLSNEVGSLARVLKIIVERNINLTKIQSIPIIGKPDEYTFYVDCEWQDYEEFRRSMEIKSYVKELTILGEYKKGKTVYDYTQSR